MGVPLHGWVQKVDQLRADHYVHRQRGKDGVERRINGIREDKIDKV